MNSITVFRIMLIDMLFNNYVITCIRNQETYYIIRSGDIRRYSYTFVNEH